MIPIKLEPREGTLLYTLHEAQRWSAAWKKAAKLFYRRYCEVYRPMIEARKVARRLLRERDTLQSQVNHLESDREQLARTVDEQRKRYDAKYAEWSELQTESSRRQAEIAALKTLLVDVDKERLELREALEQVEWTDALAPTCLWCGAVHLFPTVRHAPDCAREKALGKA